MPHNLVRTLAVVAALGLTLACCRPAEETPVQEGAAGGSVAQDGGSENGQVVDVGDVWCFPEYYRIDPRDGAVAEFGFRPVPLSFKSRNSAYDAESNTVTLVAMKGETAAFQIMVEGAHEGVEVSSEGLPAGASFTYEGYVQFIDADGTLRYGPDVAIPLEWLGGRFDVADVPRPLPPVDGKKMQAIWVDVPIPRGQPGGEMPGRVTVADSSGVLSEISVRVAVADVAIPEQPTYLGALIHYGMFVNKQPARELDAHRVAHTHRLSIHDVPYSSQRGWGYEGAVPRTTLSPVFAQVDKLREEAKRKWALGTYQLQPDLKPLVDPGNHTLTSRDDLDYRLNDTLPMHDAVLRRCRETYRKDGAGVTDWTDFDRRYGPLLDGSGFSDGIPVATFELPFNFNWPAPLDRFDVMNPRQSAMYEDIWRKVARDFLRHANQKGWTRTQFFVYINPKDQRNNLSMWKGDEPVSKKDFLAHRYYQELFDESFAEPGNVKVAYKLEIGHYECNYAKCYKADYDDKHWDEAAAAELLKEVRVWIPNTWHYHAAIELVRKRIAEEGDRYYTYGGLPPLTQSSMSIYGIAFQAFEDDSLGFFYYTPGWANLDDFVKNPGLRIRAHQGLPERTAVYYDPSPFAKDDRVLPSLRLKALRGVEQHYAAFVAAEKVDPEFGKMLKSKMVNYVTHVGGRGVGSRSVITSNNPVNLHVARVLAIDIACGKVPDWRNAPFEGPLKDVSIKLDAFHYCVNCGEACNPTKCEWCGAVQRR